MGFFTHFINLIGSSLTVGVFLAPLKSIKDIQNSTNPTESIKTNLSHLTLLVQSLNCLLWTTYGVIIDNSLLFLVNGFGFLVSLYYHWVYLRLSDQKDKVIMYTAFTLLIYVAVCGWISFGVTTFDVAQRHLGVTCSICAICLFGSPLATIQKVIKEQNADSIPGIFVLMSTLCSLFWWMYGTSKHDVFVSFPNFLGFCLSIIQLVVKFIYRTSKSSSTPLPK
eukprot:gb/GECH01001566.1/.p1 GENE.gb/GECH01001566.1/~~gb/GECH01001566.1/.p1  ORF type:complete len:223 (+),score=34.84 gb/GECH01001566.1/:1-669(+)